jgi:RNA-directed DNA polymerase
VMHGDETSDPAIVARRPPNKAGRPGAEAEERRAGAEGNAVQASTCRAQDRASVSQGLDRVREVARERKQERFTTLLHHLNPALLRLSFYALKRDAAAGVDGMRWEDYEADLEPRLADLHDRVHSGAYRALPSRRQYIPKADGRQRPLAIAALEDKIVQRALTTVLNTIYEEDFLGFSYGFRPGRGQHDALDALTVGITRRKVNWVLDADIRSFFDAVSQQWLIRFLEHRIADPRVLRLIQKWLKAGVLEDGIVTVSETGTGQGSVISPLLANVYLHYVFDLWAERWRRREAGGEMIIVRYADDVIVGFEHEADASRFLAAMRERLAEFALTLHPEKTRLLEFGRHAAKRRKERGLGKPETFNFLGFTHICGETRRGRFVVVRKSRRDRVRAKLQAVRAELRQRMHQPIAEQGRWLRQVVSGFFNYHAVPTNSGTLGAFRYHITELWRRTLTRRSERDGSTWARIARLADGWLPKPRITHPWPEERFAVRHPRWEPYAGKPHVRFCAGGAQ